MPGLENRLVWGLHVISRPKLGLGRKIFSCKWEFFWSQEKKSCRNAHEEDGIGFQ